MVQRVSEKLLKAGLLCKEDRMSRIRLKLDVIWLKPETRPL